MVVVAPRCDPRCDEVAVTSCASPLAARLCVAPTLADALADCAGSVGFTRRAGAGRVVHASLAQLLARFPAAIPALAQPLVAPAPAGQGAAAGSDDSAAAADAAPPGTVALVFGREESGLLESELMLCSHACAIPTGALPTGLQSLAVQPLSHAGTCQPHPAPAPCACRPQPAQPQPVACCGGGGVAAV